MKYYSYISNSHDLKSLRNTIQISLEFLRIDNVIHNKPRENINDFIFQRMCSNLGNRKIKNQRLGTEERDKIYF